VHRSLRIAYLHYGAQSGVTAHVTAALEQRGHVVLPIEVTRHSRQPATAVRQTLHALRFGTRARAHRWNTSHAFDLHTLQAERDIAAIDPPPELVLQNGALFSPPESMPSVLLLDHTHALTRQITGADRHEFDYGDGWDHRETRTYRSARAIAVFSARVQRSLVRDYGVDRTCVSIVGAGSGLSPSEVWRADDGATFLFVGRDFERKGGVQLLEAFARLREWRRGARLWIVGPHRRIGAHRPGIEWLGDVSPTRLETVMAHSTALVLPTLREPFGLAFLDAMACGLPCIGSRVEAVDELVEHGHTGLLVPPGDITALTAAMRQLLDDPALGRRLGAAGREQVLARHTWAHVAERLERVLLSATGLLAPVAAALLFPVAAAGRPPIG